MRSSTGNAGVVDLTGHDGGEKESDEDAEKEGESEPNERVATIPHEPARGNGNLAGGVRIRFEFAFGRVIAEPVRFETRGDMVLRTVFIAIKC